MTCTGPETSVVDDCSVDVSPKRVAKRATSGALTALRRGRTISWTDPSGNLGNFLYNWLRAWRLQQEGHEAFALQTPAMTQWLQVWPRLAQQVTITRAGVRPFDVREIRSTQCWGADYFPYHVEGFALQLLEELRDAVGPRSTGPDRLVVNVRRGDFYTDYRERYAFDLIGYLRLAFDRSIRLGGRPNSIHVVSDDPVWCQAHLAQFRSIAPLTFESEVRDPLRDLLTLTSAPRLILTNSTFGYWGAHLSNALHGANHEHVVAPWFHDRSTWFGAAYQLNPAWSIIRSIPGDWSVPVEGQ